MIIFKIFEDKCDCEVPSKARQEVFLKYAFSTFSGCLNKSSVELLKLHACKMAQYQRTKKYTNYCV